MIYLDNAATTFPKPECVYEKVNYIQRSIAVNTGRGSYSVARKASEIIDETRLLLANLTNAKSPDQVVISPSATIAANILVWGLEWDKLKNVYVSPFEHNAIARPLESIRKLYGFNVYILPFNPITQEIDFVATERMFSKHQPDYVFLNQVSNVTGVILPIRSIAELAKKYDALVVVDGSQSLGLVDINLQNSEIDYLLFAGHKNLYASWGIGGIISNSSNKLNHFFAGGTGSDSLNLEMPDQMPNKLEFGSPNIIAIASLNTSLKWLQQTTIEAIKSKKDGLMKHLISKLEKMDQVILYLPKNESIHTSVLSFNVEGYEAGEVGIILDQDYDIAVRTGYHCAPFIHDFLGTRSYKGTVRVSVGYFNTEEDIDSLATAISEL